MYEECIGKRVVEHERRCHGILLDEAVIHRPLQKVSRFEVYVAPDDPDLPAVMIQD
jgi:hypothetical protein